MQKYEFDAQDANFIISLVYIISAVASPLFGYVIDKTGRNVSWMLISILATITAHSFLAFTYVNPYVCMVSTLLQNNHRKMIHIVMVFFLNKIFNNILQISMGLSYSMLASSLWPLVALIIPEYQLGTAYGM